MPDRRRSSVMCVGGRGGCPCDGLAQRRGVVGRGASLTAMRGLLAAVALLSGFALAGCRATPASSEPGIARPFARTIASNPPGCVDRYDPGTDYFPDKATFESAG